MSDSRPDFLDNLLGIIPTPDGDTYDHERDGQRLHGLNRRVYALMADGQWRTLREVSRATGGTEASVSARLRDLRKAKFGGYRVERRRVGGGLHEYRLDLTPTH